MRLHTVLLFITVVGITLCLAGESFARERGNEVFFGSKAGQKITNPQQEALESQKKSLEGIEQTMGELKGSITQTNLLLQELIAIQKNQATLLEQMAREKGGKEVPASAPPARNR